MTHREKVEHLVAELTRRGVKAEIIAPPVWRKAWDLGWNVCPPHFMSFLAMTLLMGGVFGTLWGAFMWFFLWRAQGVLFSVAAGLTAGVMFGASMAIYYKRSAAKLDLPRWEDYPRKTEFVDGIDG